MSPALLFVLGIASADPVELNDYDPLPSYLTQGQVESRLQASTAAVGACFDGQQPPAPATALELVVAIAGDGQVSHAQVGLDPAHQLRQDCVAQALCSLSFATHDETWERWTFRMAYSQGSLFFLPGLQPVPRSRSLLFVQVPEPDDPEHQQLVSDLFGTALEPSPTQAPLPACEPLQPSSTATPAASTDTP
jgi:hypothetical protein